MMERTCLRRRSSRTTPEQEEDKMQRLNGRGSARRRRTAVVEAAGDCSPTSVSSDDDSDNSKRKERPGLAPCRMRGYLVRTIALGLYLCLFSIVLISVLPGLRRSCWQSFVARRRRRRSPMRESPPPSVVFLEDSFARHVGPLFHAQKNRRHSLSALRRPMDPDYNYLELEALPLGEPFERHVLEESDEWFEEDWDEFLEYIDDPEMDEYYYGYEEQNFTKQCIRPAWAYASHPSCNIFHELYLELTDQSIHQDFDIQYLAHGHYRDSFLFKPEVAGDKTFVLKHTRHVDYLDYDYGIMIQMRTEALLMERMTASPRIIDIYGYCGTSVMVETASEITFHIVPELDFQEERGRISQEDLDELQEEDVHPFNNYTAEEKLDIAIAMAEGIAHMHGYEEGLVTNDDVHPDQWLLANDGRIILNDMNNGVFMTWDEENQKYCKYFTSFGGDFRAPEEYAEDGAWVDEMVDIWPMGNMIYTLLVGLWPYYSEDDTRKIQKMSMMGIRPYLDARYRSRSLIERRMIEIMDQCHELKPEDRPQIFEVVLHLKETKRMHQAQQKLLLLEQEHKKKESPQEECSV